MNGTDMTIAALRGAYRSGKLTPRALMARLLGEANARGRDPAWITRLDAAALEPYLARLDDRRLAKRLPLYGIPFAIKDNIDLKGVPTTAGCPALAYVPNTSAFVVQRLIEAGAIPLGKTNLDQFATGLVGERALKVYGVPACAFAADRVPGGSSSGSAVVTAQGQVSFALGTDTAGSGRVPASFNNLFGVKPTLGLLSTRGVMPACATLDTVSLFALGADDAHDLLMVAAAYDEACVWSRRHNFTAAGQSYGAVPSRFRFGVPPESQWQTDDAYTSAMRIAIHQLETLGGKAIELGCTPLLAAARLLYEGPWVAERYHAVREIITAHPDALHPITRQIIAQGAIPTAVDAFDARYRLARYKRQADTLLAQVDAMLVPTTVEHPTKAAVAANPIGINARLGTWTNGINLLDYSALAVPIVIGTNGLPAGVTLFGPAFADLLLLSLGRALESRLDLPLGAIGLPRQPMAPLPKARNGTLEIVVCGAHLEGMPLNHQLRDRDGVLVARTHTAPHYRLYALAGRAIARAALVRNTTDGAAIEVEIWRLPMANVGSFLADIPAPLGLGQVELANGEWQCGFVCAAHALEADGPAKDVTHFGGWRNWIACQHQANTP